MKFVRYLVSCILLMGLTISARNQNSRNMESMGEGMFMVKAVYVDSDGVKWFGTSRGLCRYDNLTWRYYTEADHLIGNQVNAICFEQSQLGSELWVATTQGVSVLAVDPDGITGSTGYTTEDGLLDNHIVDIELDSRYGKFFASHGGVTWFHEGRFDSLTYTDYPLSMVDAPVRQMDMYGDTLYIAANGGIGRFVSGVDGISGATRWTSEYGMTPYSGDIKSVLVDAASNQWFGTDLGVEEHVGYKAKQNWTLYSTADGLINNEVISIAEDNEGALWFGTMGGVSTLKDGLWTSYTSSDGLLNDTVYDIAFDLDGSVWFATGAGACRLAQGEFTDFYTAVPERMGSSLSIQVYYNRALGSIHLSYVLEESAPVNACLYNMSGMLVNLWTELPSAAGEHHQEVPLTGQAVGELQGGIYILQLIQGSRTGSGKLIITP